MEVIQFFFKRDIAVILETLVFVVPACFIFYYSFLKNIGKQLAKLATTQKLIEIEETVKHEFDIKIEHYKADLNKELTEKIEVLKASLAKENISYQIGLAELTRIRYKKIEKLFIQITEIQSYIKDFLHNTKNEEEFQEIKTEFLKLYNHADTSRKVCRLFISDSLLTRITENLNSSFKAYIAFLNVYQSDPKKFVTITMDDYFSQRQYLDKSDENLKALGEFYKEVNMFDSILYDLANEIKEQIFFKELSNKLSINANGWE